MLLSAIGMLLYGSGIADAGWFVPENRIAWQAWQRGDDALSLQHWDYSSKGIYGRATVLLKMGHLREAERGFRQALNAAAGLEPAYIASIWYNLGNCLYREGALQQAREAWRQALQYHPGHLKAAHNLAVLENLIKQRQRHRDSVPPAFGAANKRKGGKQAHGDQQQSGDGFPASGAHGKQDKAEQGGGEGDMEATKQPPQKAAGVRDSMDVFLRHRLAEKSARTMPARRGQPW